MYLDRVDWNHVQDYLIQIFMALLFLLAGWFVAVAASSLIAGLLSKSPLNRWLDDMLGSASKILVPIEQKLKTILYYFIMTFVLVGFFQKLGLSMISEPLNVLLTKVLGFMPQLAAGAGLLLLAWLVASILRTILKKAFDSTKLDEKLSESLGETEQPPIGKTLSETVYWMTFLMFLPAVLDAFELEGMLMPVNEMVHEITGFLPNLLSATILFAVGWFVARIVQRLVTNLLASFGVDTLGDKVGLDKALGENRLSEVAGYLVYVFILIPVIIQSLDALEINAISTPATNMLNIIMESFPFIFGGVVILAIGYMLGKAIGTLVTNLLTTVGFNRVLGMVGITGTPEEGDTSPAAIVGKLAMIAVIYFALMEAFNMMGFEALTAILAQFLVVAGQILMGVLILGVGMFLANFAQNIIVQSATANATMLATAARIAILVLSAAMALRQMGLANEIINMAFGILLGAIGVAIAIAFGFGGRDLAAKKLEEWNKQLK